MRNRLILWIIVSLSLCVGGIMVYTYLDIRQSEVYAEYINDYISVLSLDDGVAVVDESTGEIAGYYDKVIPYYLDSDDLAAVVVKEELRGYISARTGELIFEPQFRYAWVDGENALAACVNAEGKMGFLNVETKEVAIPFQYDFDGELFCPGDWPVFDFVFSNGLCIVPGKGGTLGLINEKGELVLPIEYTDIIDWREPESAHIILERRTDDGQYLYGMCDRNFNMQLPVDYDSLELIWDYDVTAGENRVSGFIASRNGFYGLLNSSLETVLPFEYDRIGLTDTYYTNVDGIIAVKNYVPYLFDRKGQLLNDFYVPNYSVYDDAMNEFVRKIGFTPLTEPNNGIASGYILYPLEEYYGVIDGEKRVVIPARYDSIEYLGLGTFACVLNDITYLIHDKK